MKKLTVVLLLLSILISLIGCRQKGSYLDSVPCADLASNALEQIPLDLGYEAYDSEHVDYFFGNQLYDDHALYYSVKSADINEVGIFHANDKKSAGELHDKISEYLKKELEENKAFIESYAPKEIKKLENAEVRSFGNYVVFVVLDEEDKALFFDTVEILLKGS